MNLCNPGRISVKFWQKQISSIFGELKNSFAKTRWNSVDFRENLRIVAKCGTFLCVRLSVWLPLSDDYPLSFLYLITFHHPRSHQQNQRGEQRENICRTLTFRLYYGAESLQTSKALHHKPSLAVVAKIGFDTSESELLEVQLSMILAVLPDEGRINSVAQKRRRTDTGKGKETIEKREKEKKNKE